MSSSDIVYKRTELHEIYYCELCGQRVLILEPGPMAPICCGKSMEKQGHIQ